MSSPIIPWMGGKRRLAKHIIPMIPEHTCYVEPFSGGAAIFFMKPESKVEVINDLNGELVNLYRVVQNHMEEFIRQFKFSLVSRQLFKWEQMKNPETLTDIQRAARFFYLQKLCFGGKSTGQTYGTATTSKPRLNINTIGEELTEAHFRLHKTNIENLSWELCVKKYDRPHSFFYLDPPYWQTAGYGGDFDFEHYEKMAEFMRVIQGKMMISINDHPDIRKLFNEFNIKTVNLKYTVGGSKKNSDKKQELIITNY
ncbi:DNA adenine methylase [Thiomicrorhabdus sp.]|uniref:DNA adenine methylase n=1 Tax=Thiomicrorhabdus sp. TaxID=2039724 RepID=UPI00356A234C